jgi:hypothetical protein
MSNIYSREELVQLFQKAYAAEDVEAINEISAELERLDSKEEVSLPASPSLTEAVVEDSFIKDQAKAGAADFVFNMLPDSFFGVNGLDEKYNNLETGEYDYEAYERDLASAKQQASSEFFGYKGIKPLSKFERYAGAATRGTISEGPLAFIGAKGPLSAAVELAHTFAATAAGAFGGDTGAEIATSLGAPEEVAEGFRTAGGLIGGLGTSLARAPATSAFTAASKTMSERKRLASTAEKASEFLAMDELDGIIKAATKAQPDLEKVIQTTIELQDRIPNLVVPPAATLANNPIIIKNMDRLLRTKPEFLAEMRQRVGDSANAVKIYKEKNFGKAGEDLDLELRSALNKDSGIQLKNVNKRINSIDKQIEKRVQNLESKVDYVAVGADVKNLMKAKESAVRNKLSPKYEHLLRKAELDGLELSPSSVKNIYDAVRIQKLDDLFGIEPALAKAIKNTWSPKKEVVQSPILLAGGVKQKPSVREVFEPASVKDFDSLKRNLNTAIRKTKDSDSKTKLIGLKKQLQTELDTLPEAFTTAYRELDGQFYKELGIPKGTESLKQLDSARFELKTGEHLSNPEQARDFLAFTGQEGIPVVRNAILLKMDRAGVLKNGNFNANAFNQFLRRNERLIDTVPNLRQELETNASTITGLMDTKAKLDYDFNIKSRELTEGFIQGLEKKRFSDVVDSILTKPDVSVRYLNDMKNFNPETSKMLKQGMRAGLLEAAVKSDKSMVQFITDNGNVFKQWFGPRYLENVKNIASASDILAKINTNARFAVDMKNEDSLKAATRMSAPEWVSLIRDRITSNTTKIAIASSKISTRSAESKRDGHLMELLLNPEKLSDIEKLVKANKPNIYNPETVKELGIKLNGIFLKGAYFGDVGSESFETIQEDF